MANSKLLCTKLQTIDYLIKYAGNSEEQQDFPEAYLAYKECVNIAKGIFHDCDTCQTVHEKLLLRVPEWIENAIKLKNVLSTIQNQRELPHGAQTLTNQNSMSNEFEIKVTEYLKSKESSHLDEKMREKIVKFSKILQVTKPSIKFTDIVGSEEAILAARECVLYTLLDDTIKKFRHDQPMGCLLYGKLYL
jgi:ATP-dependent 26S proteasome regulatory subunit